MDFFLPVSIALLVVLYPASALTQLIDEFSAFETLRRSHYERAREDHALSSLNRRAAELDSGLTLIGRWAWGPFQAVDAQGNYAYIGNGYTFQVLDMSNAASPNIVGEFVSNNQITDIQVRESLAYVCNLDSLCVVEVSDPTTPTLIGGVYLPGGADRVRLSDSLAFVLGVGGRLQAVDIADPANLRLRGYAFAGGSVNFGDEAFAVSGRHVYVGGTTNCPCPIDIVDGTNPDNLFLTARFYPGNFHQFSAETRDTLLSVGMHSLYGADGFEIYSIANPVSPRLLGGLGVFSDVAAIAIDDTTAYVAADGRVRSISIADPSRPRVIGSVSSGTGKLAYAQGRLHVAANSGMYFIDTVPPDSLTLTAAFPTGGWAIKIALRDTLAFVASDDAGLWVLSVADAAHPRGIANVSLGGHTYDVTVEGNRVYLVNWPAYSSNDGARGLWIVDISDPLHPEVVSHYEGIVRYPNWSVPNSVASVGDLVFVTQAPTPGDDRIVEIIDVSNPGQPTQVAVVHGTFTPYDIAVKDSVLYIASFDAGLVVVDAHDLANPRRIGQVPQLDAMSVVIRDTLAFIGSANFYIIDITRPDSPFVVGSTLTHYGASHTRLAVSGGFAYWVDSQAGVVDISIPREPRQVWSATDHRGRLGVSVRGDTIYFAQGPGGVWIWMNDIATAAEKPNGDSFPQTCTLRQNYPNPFNGETAIEWSASGRIHSRVEVFNLLGQKIATLLDEVVEPGPHKVTFKPKGLASGAYAYRLWSESTILSKLMVYIK